MIINHNFKAGSIASTPAPFRAFLSIHTTQTMSIKEIQFSGLIQNRSLKQITGPEFFNALSACGWQEGTGTHFFKELRKDGISRGIWTPADLSRAIHMGTSEPSKNGKCIHRICNRSAYIVYNPTTRTLITFSPG